MRRIPWSPLCCPLELHPRTQNRERTCVAILVERIKSGQAGGPVLMNQQGLVHGHTRACPRVPKAVRPAIRSGRRLKNRRTRVARVRSKNQSSLGARPNRDSDTGSKRIGSDARTLRIFSDCDYANGALAEWRTVFERCGDVIHFPDRCGRVGDLLNQQEILLIGDVLYLEMIDAGGGLCCRAGGLWGVVVGPRRGYVCSEDFGVEKAPGNEECSRRDEEASGCSPLDFRNHTPYRTPPDFAGGDPARFGRPILA